MSSRLDRAWAVLPCACIFGDRTAVPMIEIANEWPEGQVLVVKDLRTDRLRFFCSCGDLGYKVGHRQEAYHDQTLKIIGEFEVLNVVNYRTVDGKPVMNSANSVGLDKKAPIYCFK